MTIDATEIIDDADEETDRWRKYVRAVANWFHENEEKLFERDEAIQKISNELDISNEILQETLSNIVSDTVDPVVQIPYNSKKYVGIIEYNEFDGAYGYVNFDDNIGKQNRVVCAKCVMDSDHDTEVTHATSGDPNGSFDDSTSYDVLYEAIKNHYDMVHDCIPSDVETGATLASGTTIGGNEAWHSGNDGPSSGLDADTLHGNGPSSYTRKQFFGDGSDGAITRSSNTTESRSISATTYTVDSGVTVSVDKVAFITATDRIEINGTINANGAGASGAGGGGTGLNSNGSTGSAGSLIPLGSGGGGGTGAEYAGNGGSGGDGDTDVSNLYHVNAEKVGFGPVATAIFSNSAAGAGGGGGGGGYGFEGGGGGANGSFPGGGGGGAQSASDGDASGGGTGGDGGGLVYLCAPTIEINGNITADGQNGDTSASAPARGGGGGGGSGGVVVCRGNTVTGESSITVNGGSGGGGSGNGASGASGEILILEGIET